MKPLLDLDPARAVVAPREAATVILVRDAAGGSGGGSGELEVFAVERHQASRFLGGSVVFPGGKLDEADGADSWLPRVTTPLPWPDVERGGDEEAGRSRALAICACRETLEEAGLLLVDGEVDDAAIAELRARMKADPGALLAFLGERSLRLTLDAMVPLARWITPTAEPRRYDTRFFLARAPRGQTGVHDDHETVSSVWATPSSLLARFGRSELQLAPPTQRTLEHLARAHDVAGAFAMARTQSLLPVCPEAVKQADGSVVLLLPGDPEHSVKDPRLAGATRFVQDGAAGSTLRWVPWAPSAR